MQTVGDNLLIDLSMTQSVDQADRFSKEYVHLLTDAEQTDSLNSPIFRDFVNTETYCLNFEKYSRLDQKLTSRHFGSLFCIALLSFT